VRDTVRTTRPVPAGAPGRSEPEADLGRSAVARYGRSPSGAEVPPRADPV